MLVPSDIIVLESLLEVTAYGLGESHKSHRLFLTLNENTLPLSAELDKCIKKLSFNPE